MAVGKVRTMGSELERTVGALFHGWVELVSLFLVIVIITALFGLFYWRSFRPADRGPVIAWPLVLAGTALAFILRSGHSDLTSAIIISVALLIAGLLGRGIPPSGLWIPTILFAALLGMGFMLSAIIFAVIGVVVLMLSSTRER